MPAPPSSSLGSLQRLAATDPAPPPGPRPLRRRRVRPAADAATSRTPIADRDPRPATSRPSIRRWRRPPSVAAASAAHMRDGRRRARRGRHRESPAPTRGGSSSTSTSVNDTIGGVPVAVAFCEQCTGAAAFRRELEGRVLSMEVPGVYNGTIILRDRETRTLWAPFSGKALEGPLAGKTLERVPLSLTRWSEWKARHPATERDLGPAAGAGRPRLVVRARASGGSSPRWGPRSRAGTPACPRTRWCTACEVPGAVEGRIPCPRSRRGGS